MTSAASIWILISFVVFWRGQLDMRAYHKNTGDKFDWKKPVCYPHEFQPTKTGDGKMDSCLDQPKFTKKRVLSRKRWQVTKHYEWSPYPRSLDYSDSVVKCVHGKIPQDRNIRNVMVELCRPGMRIVKHGEISLNLASAKSSTIGSLNIDTTLWDYWGTSNSLK